MNPTSSKIKFEFVFYNDSLERSRNCRKCKHRPNIILMSSKYLSMACTVRSNPREYFVGDENEKLRKKITLHWSAIASLSYFSLHAKCQRWSFSSSQKAANKIYVGIGASHATVRCLYARVTCGTFGTSALHRSTVLHPRRIHRLGRRSMKVKRSYMHWYRL
jgi:hypothetical protein